MPTEHGEWIWIYSHGGPLMLLPAKHLPAWEGIHPPGDGRSIQATFRWAGPGTLATDYDRATDIDGYLGVLKVGRGDGLVLGDEPMMTAWRPDASQEGGLLVRWVFAESEASVIDSLRRLPEDIWQPTEIVFSIDSAPLYLFDAAVAEDPPANDDEGGGYLVIDLLPGRYAVVTGLYAPDAKTSLVLHRLSRTVEKAARKPGYSLSP